MKRNTLVLLFILILLPLNSQNKSAWDVQWIIHPQADLLNYGVFHFRKTISLAEKPTTFPVRISADNKYKLFVNGIYVSSGPVLGDANNWFYDTIDLAPFLLKGENTIAALVWNFGNRKGENQISMKSAFILQAENNSQKDVNTDNRWKVEQNNAYSPKAILKGDGTGYLVIGCGDSIDGNKNNWRWKTAVTENWNNVKTLEKANPKGFGSGCTWALTPRMIPLLEEKIQRFPVVRRATIPVDKSFLSGEQKLSIAANTTVSILFDQTSLINAFPTLTFSKGKGAKITLTYCESLFDSKGQKGNRNEIDNKIAKGFKDVIVASGDTNCVFQPLEYRTYRYLQLDITTAEEALVLNNLQQMAVSYPFTEKASFVSNDSSLTKIWNVGWRTARLCAMDTYMDCPYYERLQYVGDTRIQALISLYVAGDDRLMRQAITMLNSSRIGEGLTLSSYPSNATQKVIPPFSLYWVDMIYDYSMLRSDADFVRQFLPGVIGVLDWYERHIDKQTGMLGKTPYWSFVDWAKEWAWDTKKNEGGVPLGGGIDGESAITTLQFVYTLQHAATIFNAQGKSDQATYYSQLATKISKAVYKNCWAEKRQLLSDTPDKTSFSQHANIWAVLTNTIPTKQQKVLITKVLNDKSLIQCTIYFRFYLAQALFQAGLGNQYIDSIEPWRQALTLGLTTFPETPEPSRSDCHAWSASPNYDFLATVCGIRPMEVGFRNVRIAPNLCNLKNVEAQMPHPLGEIKVKFVRQGTIGIEAEITLPTELTGEFVWNGKVRKIYSGINKIEVL
jgi:hypothetical protein